MNQQEKTARLKKYLEAIAPDKLNNPSSVLENAGLESLGSETASSNEEALFSQKSGLEKLVAGNTLSPTESFGLEAIIHKVERPVFFIMKNSFAEPPGIWEHFGSDSMRPKLERACSAIGRVELPARSGYPYGGTAFVVGPNLLMTNRHVAEIFASGLGIQRLDFKSDWSAGFNLRKEHTIPEIQDLAVSEVVMIHPYWDMALLRVEGLAPDQPILELTSRHPEDMPNLEIAVIGYPAQDNRNDITLQNQIFSGIFGVKRMQPGKLTGTRIHESFGNNVTALTHDASTLAGNSGSAVVDAITGQIIALHFAGFYLDTNFAVPTFELARDQRIIDTGVRFDKSLETTNEWENRWAIADSMSESIGGSSHLASKPTDSNQSTIITSDNGNNSVSVTIPLTITVSLGDATTVTNAAVGRSGSSTGQQVTTKHNTSQSSSNAHVSTLKHSAYSTNAALTCAICSSLTYSADIDDVTHTATEVLGFDDCQLINDAETTCIVASTPDTVLIAFKGTTSTLTWLRNLASHTERTHHGSLHNGFLQTFLAINQQLKPVTESIGLGHKEIVLTGHGPGGALATIAASEWRALYPIRSIYTFGQPAVGTLEFKDSMTPFNQLIYRVVAPGDVVTKIPPHLLHTGKQINIDSKNGADSTSAMLDEADFQQLQQSLRVIPDNSHQRPSLPNHAINHYIEQLQALIT